MTIAAVTPSTEPTTNPILRFVPGSATHDLPPAVESG
jgi:hypothetical protein